MRLLLAEKDNISDSAILITDREDIKHVVAVTRQAVGDAVRVSDGEGRLYKTVIEEIGKGGLRLRIVSMVHADDGGKKKITLFQGLPKGGKMDTIVQKATELGADMIIPFISERSVAKGEKSERWRRIARESVKQCGRLYVPAVGELIDMPTMYSELAGYELAILLSEHERSYSMKNVLQAPGAEAGSIAIVVGPEGGFTPEETGAAKDVGGAYSVTLGSAILRTETAGAAALAMILYEFSL